MSSELSVILCTHNPRLDYLSRTMKALTEQTLPRERWEFVLVDNASAEPLQAAVDLSWHPRARHVREEKLGLTPARFRGYQEAAAELLVFVDDDNVLAPDYLESAARLASQWPILGTWGGQCEAEYEVRPAPSLIPYVHGLAIRTCTRDSWSNRLGASEAYPFGAGLCVRRSVMTEYYRSASQCELRQSLGRTGEQLLSGEDYDINLTACEMGLGCGVFQALKLTHLIPKRRVTEDYLLRIFYGHSFSNAVLFATRGQEPFDPFATIMARLFWRMRLLRLGWQDRRFRWAELTGVHDAVTFLRTH
jgi:glycosyltransferase involved in cell wall biosynthesis